MADLEALYANPEHIVVTAHRGLSARYPENTLLAFEQALAVGCEAIEFDVHGTADGVPVIMHDHTVDRTTDGTGPVSSLRLAELKKLNASCWEGPHVWGGYRRKRPRFSGVTVPTLEEALDLLTGQVALNIQVYAETREVQERIVELYAGHGLYGQAFLMVSSFAEAEVFRQLDPEVELCVGEDRANCRRHHEFGLRLMQPWREDVNETYAAELVGLGMWANMFYTNTVQEFETFWRPGLRGVLSDLPDVLLRYLRSLGKA